MVSAIHWGSWNVSPKDKGETAYWMGTLSQRLKISVNAGNPQEKSFYISNEAVPSSSLRNVAGAPRLTNCIKDKMVECFGFEECFVPAGMSK